MFVIFLNYTYRYIEIKWIPFRIVCFATTRSCVEGAWQIGEPDTTRKSTTVPKEEPSKLCLSNKLRLLHCIPLYCSMFNLWGHRILCAHGTDRELCNENQWTLCFIIRLRSTWLFSPVYESRRTRPSLYTTVVPAVRPKNHYGTFQLQIYRIYPNEKIAVVTNQLIYNTFSPLSNKRFDGLVRALLRKRLFKVKIQLNKNGYVFILIETGKILIFQVPFNKR